MSATADQELVELRRANAELLKERDAALVELQTRSAALAQRNTEYDERIGHQSATIDVLKAMSASPGDPQPVFDLIVRHANKLCNGSGVGLFEFDGNMVHLRANLFGDAPAVAIARYRATFPMVPNRGSISCRAILDKQTIHIADYQGDPEIHPTVKAMGYQSQLSIPLMRDGAAIGVISLGGPLGGFTDSQVALLQTFAEQAVIAITSAETYRALQGRTSDLEQALEQQTATAEVLQVINSSPGDLAPVFDALLERALQLCESMFGILCTFDGSFHTVAMRGVAPGYADLIRAPFHPVPGMCTYDLVLGKNVVHITDITTDASHDLASPFRRALADQSGGRTGIWVALRHDDVLVGMINIFRSEVRPYSDQQIALLQNFAAQAVIAMENARLINETREALEQQTATAEVLEVINASPGELTPVFDAMLERAMHLCESDFGILATYDGAVFHHVAFRGVTPELAEFLRKPMYAVPSSAVHRVIQGENVIHTADIVDDDAYRDGMPARRALADLGGARTQIVVALRKDDVLLGVLNIFRQEVRAFSHSQIALLQNFAAQAVIAMENARLLNELRQRQEELRITFENMGDGVALFDETHHLVASNGRFRDMLDVPDDVISSRPAFADYIRYLADRGEYGSDPEAHVQHLLALGSQPAAFERTRPNGCVIEVKGNPVPGGGFVVIYSDITERKRNEAEIRAARDTAEQASRTIEAAYRDLKTAQASLIQAEKMASLGQLTAGIAHEIKNPLNFVNNFASLSVDLLDELKQTAEPGLALLDVARRAEVDDLTRTLASNLDKINEHGRRADGIVRGMLEHSRGSSGERRSVDLNTLVEEALNLAHHGARAQDQNFNVTLQREYGEGIAAVALAPQDITRVLLNLYSNGFYAARERQRRETPSGFEPTLQVSTSESDDAVEIRVRDNGIGIPVGIRDRLFQPFFTTKPPGEGTGLGLSMSYEIITQQHGGNITVDSKVGEYSEFTIKLPRRT